LLRNMAAPPTIGFCLCAEVTGIPTTMIATANNITASILFMIFILYF